MKQTSEEPETEVIVFDAEDLIVTSAPDDARDPSIRISEMQSPGAVKKLSASCHSRQNEYQDKKDVRTGAAADLMLLQQPLSSFTVTICPH